MAEVERWEEVAGRVVRQDGRHVLVWTAQGEFLRIPAPRGRTLRPGQRVRVRRPRPPRASPAPRWLAVAAVLALLAGSLLGYPPGAEAQPAAVLALEINPAADLDLDAAGRVVRTWAGNADGARLLAATAVVGLPWDEALTRLIGQALAEGWLRPGGVVVVAVAPLAGGTQPPAVERVAAVLRQALAGRATDVSAAVLPAGADDVRAARRAATGLVRQHLVRRASLRGSDPRAASAPLAELLTMAGVEPTDTTLPRAPVPPPILQSPDATGPASPPPPPAPAPAAPPPAPPSLAPRQAPPPAGDAHPGQGSQPGSPTRATGPAERHEEPAGPPQVEPDDDDDDRSLEPREDTRPEDDELPAAEPGAAPQAGRPHGASPAAEEAAEESPAGAPESPEGASEGPP